MEQIMEMLKTMLADDNAWREKMKAETEAIRARMKAHQEKLDTKRKTAKIDTIEEMDARHKEMTAWLTDTNDN
jgi:hypothetical protein